MKSTNSARPTTGDGPQRGAEDLGIATHGLAASSRATDQKPLYNFPAPVRTTQGGQHPCAGTKKSGKPCGIKNTALCTDGQYWCRHHRKDKTKVHDSVSATLPPPPTRLDTKADVDKTYKWLFEAIYLGKVNGNQAKEMRSVVKQRSELRARLDEDLVDLYRELTRIVVKVIELTFDHDERPVPADIRELIEEHERVHAKKRHREAAWLDNNPEAATVLPDRRRRHKRQDARLAELEEAVAQKARAEIDPDDPDTY